MKYCIPVERVWFALTQNSIWYDIHMFLEIINLMYIGCKQCGIPYWAQYSKVPFYCKLA